MKALEWIILVAVSLLGALLVGGFAAWLWWLVKPQLEGG